MTQYYCTRCHNIMDEVEALVSYPEPHPELEGCPTEWISVPECIFCGASAIDLEEAVRCEACGEWYGEEELTDGICPDCLEKEKSAPDAGTPGTGKRA